MLFICSLDLEKKLLNFDLLIPKLRIDATYSLKGNILLLPIVGSGNVAMTMKDVKSSVYTKISIRKQPEVGSFLPILNFVSLLWMKIDSILINENEFLLICRKWFTSMKWKWHSWLAKCEFTWTTYLMVTRCWAHLWICSSIKMPKKSFPNYDRIWSAV